MALWGKLDALASAPKWVARKAWFDASSATVVIAASDRINLIPSNTGFSTGDAVYYSINGGTAVGGMTDEATYYVRVVAAGQIELYDTYAHAVDTENTTGLVDITDVGAGTQTLQRTGAANPYDHDFNGKAIFFVDRTEAQLEENKKKGIKGGGWWLYSTYVDANGNTRHKASCLVAIDVVAGTSGDASDDQTIPDKGLIVTVPATVTIVDGATGSIAATATTDPVGGSLTYAWEVSTNNGASWSTVTNGGIYSTATAASLTLTAPTYAYNGYKYRVTVSGTGYATKTAVATLAVTPVTIAISVQPTNQSVTAPATATFSVTAATTPTGRTLGYQWAYSDDEGATWTDIVGATSASYTTGDTTGLDGREYHVTVSRAGATSRVSNAAVLTVS